MAKTTNYSELVAEAEQSVQGVKDPELRRIAFQKVLEELLSGGRSTDTSPRRRARNTPADRPKIRRKTPRGATTYLRELVDDGFFKKQVSITDVKVQLENQGHHIP